MCQIAGTGSSAISNATKDLTGDPSNVFTSKSEDPASHETKLYPPSSKNQERRTKVKAGTQHEKPNLAINGPKENKEDDKLKQTTFKEFMEISKKKVAEKEKKDEVDQAFKD